MARIRSIKPEFWVSEQIAECSTNARLTFIGLWTFCDDGGVHPAKAKTLKAELFPMDDVSANDVQGWIDELIAVGLVAKFESGGASYWAVTGWSKHQKIDRPSRKHPSPPAAVQAANGETFDEDSTSTRQAVDEDSSDATPRSGVDRKGEDVADSAKPHHSPAKEKGSKRKPALVPIPDDFGVSDQVRTWASSRGFGQYLDAHLEHFVGWAKGKAHRYADWDQTFQNAIRDDYAGVREKLSGRGRSAASSGNDALFARGSQ